MSEKQLWSSIETNQALDFLNRIYQRVDTFGLENLDDNTIKCVNKIFEINRLVEEKHELECLRKGK